MNTSSQDRVIPRRIRRAAAPSASDYLAHYPPALARGSTVVQQWWGWRGSAVHLARMSAPDAPLVVIMLHGAGGHSGMLAPFGRLVEGRAEVIVPDLPGYGLTRLDQPATYDDWIDCVADLVRAQDRPVVLVGASMGGMLAYDVAAAGAPVAAVLATCLLDPSDPEALARVTPWFVPARRAPALLKWARPIDTWQVPIRWMSRMSAMSNEPGLADLVRRDPLGGGNAVSLRFLGTWMTSRRPRPEEFTACRVVLAHPAADAWTPPQLSERFLRRIAAPTELVMLENAGHLPVEQPGLGQLRNAVHELLDAVDASG